MGISHSIFCDGREDNSAVNRLLSTAFTAGVWGWREQQRKQNVLNINFILRVAHSLLMYYDEYAARIFCG